MITLAQRITQLREEKGLSRPALAAALGLPKTAVEKFESGRQTPTQDQQNKLAAFFGVSVFYLQGKGRDRTRMEDWLDDMAPAQERPASTPPAARPSAPPKSTPAEGGLFDAMLTSRKFQEVLSKAVLDTLRSPEGQAILSQIVRKELDR